MRRQAYQRMAIAETHVGSIMAKLDRANTPDDHRRVLAVPAWLNAAVP